MKTKKLLLLGALLIATSSLWAAYPTILGDGTADNPYKITSATELLNVRDSVNLVSNLTLNLAHYELSNDIDMSGTEWTVPIGIAGKNFKGIFNGNGHKITGIFLNSGTTPHGNQALFGQINTATIKNLEININFTIVRSGTIGNIYVGGLVNNITAGVTGAAPTFIDNCRVTGVLSQTNTSAGAATEKMGGIVGQNGFESYITNCSVDLQMINTIILGSAGGCINGVGGIVGDAGVGVKSGIVNCYSTGSLTIFDSAGATSGGGILGVRNGTNTPLCEIINCYSAMTIDASQSLQTNSGIAGISGSQNNTTPNTIKNCIALNPSISYKNSGANLGLLKRMALKNAGATFASNYALSSMTITAFTAWNFTTQTGTTATFTPVNDAAGTDGDVLTGADVPSQIADGLSKLSAYVTANPTYSPTSATTLNLPLLSWTAGTTYPKLVTPIFSGLSNHTILPSLKYSVNAGVLKLDNIEGKKSLRIYSVTGVEVNKTEVNSNYSIALQKGIYIVNLEGNAPQKVVVF